jgi:anaerobic selenocysteine-containing dehydrogenase
MPKGMWRRDGHHGFTANVFAPDHLSDLAGGASFNDARVEVSAIAASLGG